MKMSPTWERQFRKLFFNVSNLYKHLLVEISHNPRVLKIHFLHFSAMSCFQLLPLTLLLHLCNLSLCLHKMNHYLVIKFKLPSQLTWKVSDLNNAPNLEEKAPKTCRKMGFVILPAPANNPCIVVLSLCSTNTAVHQAVLVEIIFV